MCYRQTLEDHHVNYRWFHMKAFIWKRIGVMVYKNRYILTAPEHLLTAAEDL